MAGSFSLSHNLLFGRRKRAIFLMSTRDASKASPNLRAEVVEFELKAETAKFISSRRGL